MIITAEELQGIVGKRAEDLKAEIDKRCNACTNWNDKPFYRRRNDKGEDFNTALFAFNAAAEAAFDFEFKKQATVEIPKSNDDPSGLLED